jgi:DNA mismatch repair protein MutS
MRANQILARIEANNVNQSSIGQNILGNEEERMPKQVNLFESPAMDLVEELKKLDVMAMTPIDAMNALFVLQEKARRA